MIRRTERYQPVVLTAEFRGVPTEHENEQFEVELHFSETLHDRFSYATLESAVSVTNGEVDGVRRLIRQDAAIGDEVAVGAISNTDAMPRAWLLRFGAR